MSHGLTALGETPKSRSSILAYWQGYRDAIKSVEQLIKDNEP